MVRIPTTIAERMRELPMWSYFLASSAAPVTGLKAAVRSDLKNCPKGSIGEGFAAAAGAAAGAAYCG